MTESFHDRTSPLAKALGHSFQTGWRQVVAADPHEPSLDRLAACAEGRLTPREEANVAREIAASPAAMEILAALIEESGSPRPLPSLEQEAQAPEIIRLPERATSREGRRAQLAAWAVAASLAVAAWGLLASRNSRQEVAALSNRADRATAALLLTKKEEVAALARRERSPLVIGASSPELTELALESLDEQLSGGSRDMDFLDDEEIEALDRAQQGLYAAAREFKKAGLEGELEFVAALIQSGRLDEASEALAVIADAAAQRGLRAEWQNLRGTLLATQAADSSLSVAEPLLGEAETLFRQSAEGGVTDAWLNLALVLAEQDETTGAEAALERYRASRANPDAATSTPQN
jgi:hypothetical protein